MSWDYIIFDIETTSLVPAENGRVTCISCFEVATEKMTTFLDADEQILLNQFWDYIKSFKAPCLVGFNSADFDFPYVIHRSVVRKTPISYFKPIDLRLTTNAFFISYKKDVKGSLSYWASIMQMKQETNNGAQMINLFFEKKYDEIKKHCEEDVKITYELFKRCKEVNLISDKGELFGKY